MGMCSVVCTRNHEHFMAAVWAAHCACAACGTPSFDQLETGVIDVDGLGAAGCLLENDLRTGSPFAQREPQGAAIPVRGARGDFFAREFRAAVLLHPQACRGPVGNAKHGHQFIGRPWLQPLNRLTQAAAAGAQFRAMASHHRFRVGDPLAMRITNDAYVLPERLPATPFSAVEGRIDKAIPGRWFRERCVDRLRRVVEIVTGGPRRNTRFIGLSLIHI